MRGSNFIGDSNSQLLTAANKQLQPSLCIHSGDGSSSNITVYDARSIKLRLSIQNRAMANYALGRYDKRSQKIDEHLNRVDGKRVHYTAQEHQKTRWRSSIDPEATVKSLPSAPKVPPPSANTTMGRLLPIKEKEYQNFLIKKSTHLLREACRDYKDESATASSAKTLSGKAKHIRDRNNFVKIVPAKDTTKPKDCDLIFGNANFQYAKKVGWKSSRLEGMPYFEGNQESRKEQCRHLKLEDESASSMDLCCFPFVRNVFMWHFG